MADSETGPLKARAGADRDGGYGWISIALHWLAAAAILALLFTGDSIASTGLGTRHIHTTIAALAWLVLASRIVWRLVQGHPPRPPGHGKLTFFTGALVHYVLLGAITLMLVSGPVAGWASGQGIDVFSLHLSGAVPAQPLLHTYAQNVHVFGATTLAIGTSLHVAGVLKHMFIDRDKTLDRIMAPPARKARP
jgi:cytochrome b561